MSDEIALREERKRLTEEGTATHGDQSNKIQKQLGLEYSLHCASMNEGGEHDGNNAQQQAINRVAGSKIHQVRVVIDRPTSDLKN